VSAVELDLDAIRARARCNSRKLHRDSVIGSIRIRCDLDEGHEGRHELRSRTSGQLVTSWTTGTDQ
jgi:hypothetical protein